MAAIIILALLILIIKIRIIFRYEIKAALEKDPAAMSALEIILLYSGLHAIIFYRIARLFLIIKMPLTARFISQVGRFFTGTEIHPGAKIGKGLFIDHGMGVVIGETTIIGDNVLIYQGVTLGGTGKHKGKRHPTIGDNVVIGTGAKVLGNITVGDSSYVGANAVVLKDVPKNATVIGIPARVTKQDGKKLDFDLDHIHIIDPIMQNIEEIEKRISLLENRSNKS